MNKCILFFILFVSIHSYSQTDFSNQWEDFFSYNNVKKITFTDNTLYALTDNAAFTYNLSTEETQKLSSVNGLSGGTTAAFHYNETYNRLVIGYDNGLIEVVNDDGTVTVSPDIVNFNQSGLKRINHIYEHDNKLYLATSFAIIVYDIEKLEFGDTYFIGPGSSSINIYQTTVLNNTIYAATENGIYTADVNNNSLIDASNWTLQFSGNYQKIVTFSSNVYTVQGSSVSRINGTTLQNVISLAGNIIDITASDTHLAVSLNKSTTIYDAALTAVGSNTVSSIFDFSLNSAQYFNGKIFLATERFGVLSGDVGLQNYTEIHPKGPLANTPFSIDVHNNNLWIVYGGYDATFTPSQNRQGFSRYNGEDWFNTLLDPSDLFGDLVNVTIDKSQENHAFISSFGDTNRTTTKLTGGLYEVQDDQIINFYNHLNSPLQDIVPTNPNRVTIRISDTAFDRDQNLWVTNVQVSSQLKKLSPAGQWTSYDLNELYVDKNRPGMSEIVIDNTNSLWITTRGNGVFVFNENGNRKRALTTEPTKGSLPNINVKSIALDQNNRMWIGTVAGLVVYNNPSRIFDENVYDAAPVIIEDDNVAERLLGDQTVNAITVDGANNKWFGTDNGGVLYTNPNGQNTLANFNTENSPLPSNKILKIAINESSGKVFIATDKGLVAYDSKVAPFGDELGEVYAYPNPVLNVHDSVTINGRNGTNLPKGTNLKILDVAGNLVYETNVVEGQQLEGGKIVWNKRNLAGQKVASGVYIALLTNDDGSESTSTKIAIVN